MPSQRLGIPGVSRHAKLLAVMSARSTPGHRERGCGKYTEWRKLHPRIHKSVGANPPINAERDGKTNTVRCFVWGWLPEGTGKSPSRRDLAVVVCCYLSITKASKPAGRLEGVSMATVHMSLEAPNRREGNIKWMYDCCAYHSASFPLLLFYSPVSQTQLPALPNDTLTPTLQFHSFLGCPVAPLDRS
jgi:hypothetical protein